jgi:hypothetical protein
MKLSLHNLAMSIWEKIYECPSKSLFGSLFFNKDA